MTLLSAREVHAGYGTLEVLHGIDFEVNEGELVAVLGPNGAGKSSLLGCLARTVRTYSGSISWEGESLLSKRTSDVSAMGIAFVPQDANVFSDLSVRENIAVAVSAMATRSEKALRAKQAAESVFDRFPFLRSREHQPAGLLSGGERQTLAVSMAFLQMPRVMLLDEPTAGLSPLAANNLTKWILELVAEGIAIVWVVEQDPETVLKAASRAYLLDGGDVRFAGAASELAGQGPDLLFQFHAAPTERTKR